MRKHPFTITINKPPPVKHMTYPDAPITNEPITNEPITNEPITNAEELKEAFIRAGRDHMFSDYDMLFKALKDPAVEPIELCDDNIFPISVFYNEYKNLDVMIEEYDYMQVCFLDGDEAKLDWFRDGAQVLRNDKGVIIIRDHSHTL